MFSKMQPVADGHGHGTYANTPWRRHDGSRRSRSPVPSRRDVVAAAASHFGREDRTANACHVEVTLPPTPPPAVPKEPVPSTPKECCSPVSPLSPVGDHDGECGKTDARCEPSPHAVGPQTSVGNWWASDAWYPSAYDASLWTTTDTTGDGTHRWSQCDHTADRGNAASDGSQPQSVPAFPAAGVGSATWADSGAAWQYGASSWDPWHTVPTDDSHTLSDDGKSMPPASTSDGVGADTWSASGASSSWQSDASSCDTRRMSPTDDSQSLSDEGSTVPKIVIPHRQYGVPRVVPPPQRPTNGPGASQGPHTGSVSVATNGQQKSHGGWKIHMCELVSVVLHGPSPVVRDNMSAVDLAKFFADPARFPALQDSLGRMCRDRKRAVQHLGV